MTNFVNSVCVSEWMCLCLKKNYVYPFYRASLLSHRECILFYRALILPYRVWIISCGLSCKKISLQVLYYHVIPTRNHIETSGQNLKKYSVSVQNKEITKKNDCNVTYVHQKDQTELLYSNNKWRWCLWMFWATSFYYKKN